MKKSQRSDDIAKTRDMETPGSHMIFPSSSRRRRGGRDRGEREGWRELRNAIKIVGRADSAKVTIKVENRCGCRWRAVEFSESALIASLYTWTLCPIFISRFIYVLPRKILAPAGDGQNHPIVCCTYLCHVIKKSLFSGLLVHLASSGWYRNCFLQRILDCILQSRFVQIPTMGQLLWVC